MASAADVAKYFLSLSDDVQQRPLLLRLRCVCVDQD